MNAVANVSSISAMSWSRNFLWLIKRELWEHRALYIAPVVFAGVILFGVILKISYFHDAAFFVNGVGLPAIGDEAYRNARIFGYLALAVPFNLVMVVVIAIYAMGTLSSERRSRSILFWKSLPISDMETVLSKLAVAMVVAPVLSVAVAILTQLLVFTLLGFTTMSSASGFLAPRRGVPVLDEIQLMLYATIVQSLWYAPVWAWCLLASSWANRASVLWAITPPLALMLIERLVFNTNTIGTMLGHRLNGVLPLSISANGAISADELKSGHLAGLINPGAFLSAPESWIGLAVAAGLIVATIWLRRYREAD